MKNKFRYLPEVNIENAERKSETLKGIYPCPCCGYKTFPVPKEEAIAYICPVCMWENDIFTISDDEPSDENRGLSLNEARKNYKTFGACEKELIKYARKPTYEEKI